MNWRRRACLLFLLTSFALLAHATPGTAFTRKIGVSGTSTSAGTCQIIIESFGLTGGHSSLAPIVINVAIPISSTASNSAILIRNDVDAALPADFVVTVPAGEPNVVRIDRSPGTFTMTINNSVPGQTIVEIAVTPVLNGLFSIVLAVLLALAGSLLLMVYRGRLRLS